MQKYQCRIANSLGGGFAGTPSKVWGTTGYKDVTEPTVFFGMYGIRDFFALWNHKGQKAILWAGSDITHFINGWWLDERGNVKVDPKAFGHWIQENCESYVENDLEREELLRFGIIAKVVPSFLGDVDMYPIRWNPPKKTTLYTSVSGDDFELYGWNLIDEIAERHPDVLFHLYGNTAPWLTDRPNVFVHGRVTQEEMNEDIQNMTGALRLTKHDGFSEILAKSILWGQWPVSPFIEYPHIAKNISSIKDKTEPNFDGREHYLEVLNQYPWNSRKTS